MGTKQSRREFVKAGVATGLTAMTSGRRWLWGETNKKVRIGFVGVGARGSDLVDIALDMPGVEIPAICDINKENLEKNLHVVERRGHGRPEGYSNGEEDFRRMVTRDDLDAVITATPREWHAPVMIATMKAGKYGGTEVQAALTVEDCWDLVRTSESTKMPLMILENVCYYREVMGLLNMVREGVFGELLHCAGGYQHDGRAIKFDKNGELLWRGKLAVNRNGNLYPTHPIGPIAHWTNINRGDRFTYLVSMSSNSRGLSLYSQKKFGIKRQFAQGDINTTLLKTQSGITVTLYYDNESPRPYDLAFRVQGTQGIYSKTLDKIHIEGKSPQEHVWEPADKYIDQYEHAMWKALGEKAKIYPHGGGDYLVIAEFVKAVRDKTQFPIDVYDAATWSVITPLSMQSVGKGSAPVQFPDFTQGKWKMNKPSFGLPDAGSSRAEARLKPGSTTWPARRNS